MRAREHGNWGKGEWVGGRGERGAGEGGGKEGGETAHNGIKDWHKFWGMCTYKHVYIYTYSYVQGFANTQPKTHMNIRLA